MTTPENAGFSKDEIFSLEPFPSAEKPGCRTMSKNEPGIRTEEAADFGDAAQQTVASEQGRRS